MSALSAIIVGVALILSSNMLLVYSLKRDDWFILVGIFGGFIPFAVGFSLIFFCFLASPPTVFGVTVQHLPLPWTDHAYPVVAHDQ